VPFAPTATTRLVLATTGAALLCALLPASAQGWGNGGDFRDGRTGYGTHDWVVDQAARVAGGHAWGGRFDVRRAVAHSGDPDALFRRPTEHVYMQRGQGRGAVEQAAEYYVAAVRAYRAGNYGLASEKFGVMSHFYSDVTMPLHSAYRGGGSVGHRHHETYERFTSHVTSSPQAARSYCPTGTKPLKVRDVRTMTAQAAAYSRRQAPELVSGLQHYGINDAAVVKNAKVKAVTKRTLTRACAGLAALLQSVPSGSAMPRQVGKVKVELARKIVKVGSAPKATIKVKDRQGRPMEGVEFWIDWPGTSRDQRLYTMPNGKLLNHGAKATSSGHRGKVRVTVLDAAGPGSPVADPNRAYPAARGSNGQITVTKSYRTTTVAALKKQRKAQRLAARAHAAKRVAKALDHRVDKLKARVRHAHSKADRRVLRHRLDVVQHQALRAHRKYHRLHARARAAR
jgi:hypothetical protein